VPPDSGTPLLPVHEPAPAAGTGRRTPLLIPSHVIVSTRWGTFGDLATAAFVIAAVSGVAVAIPYEAADGYGSIAALLLANPAAAFFRNIHYWAGQACLVLTLLHAWDHLRAHTEHRVGRGVWLRLALTLPLLAFVMLSGFMLRGDADARQAFRIVTEATAQVPLLGPLVATFVFGATERLDVIYVQHAATATIVVWLFIIEHARRVWPRAWSFLVVLVATAAISLLLSPGLHDGIDPIVKGPWYFLGLQEILHWTPWPVVVVLAGIAIVGAIFAIRVIGPRGAAWTKGTLLALVVVYAGLCGVGALLRGENWTLVPTSPVGGGNLRVGFVFTPTPEAPLPLPMVMGRPEGCLVCHKGVTGLGNSHRPDAVGCASCHGGDLLTLDKARAHGGMDVSAGNLATAMLRCGQVACHPTIVPRVERSVMTTMSGIIAVNRMVFGETPARVPAGSPHVRRLGRSAADTHLRQLCASCHLGAPRTMLGPNDEDTRGGGCNACHLSYSPAALDALRRYERDKPRGAVDAPTVHPAISLDIDNGQCFGCHSRSGRISTSYEGWHEVHEPPAEASDPARSAPSRFRTLADDRVFERVTPDIHQQRGLDCIDCHTSNEVMGDGVAHTRKSQQLRVACEDCHARPGTSLSVVPASGIDPESRKILVVRQWPGPVASHYARTPTNDLLVNVVLNAAGQPTLIRKRTGERRELKPAARVCLEGQGHMRLSCGSCHTAWAPRCPTCHTSFDATSEAYDWVDDSDVRGAWKEKAGAFVADLPTLGVRRRDAANGGRPDVIDTFVPGMILTIDRPAEPGRPADTLFRRLYARVEPHTTRREARSCMSCHNDPVALGYGRGALRYERTPAGGRWRFTPAMAPLPHDALPADAWIPFLGSRTGMVSTRDDVRPFTGEEQRRILRVGACLTCHDGNSRIMRDSVRDFAALLARRDPRCLFPAWDN
jgi:quinol-cytochrome oxidoreductase complex cytochrome b subunit